MAKKGLDRNAGLIPADPKESDLKGVIPVGFSPITLEPLEKPLTSGDIIARVRNLGMSSDEIPIRLFRDSKFGKPRKRDNTDLITGYPFYGVGQIGVESLVEVKGDVSSFIDDYRSALASDEVLADMEEEDLKKISILRPTFLGRHLQPPISLDFVHKPIPSGFKSTLERVVKRYVSASTYSKTGQAAILDGTDAKDTALGSPTFYAGDLFHGARLATLSALPVPDYSKAPGFYLSALENHASYFPDPSLIYASYLSFRQGAIAKPLPLWTHTGLGYTANHQATGLYTRQRAVWAAAFYINVIITPLVLRMKSSRKNILGMWHDPVHEAAYTTRLQSQGKISYEIDYSSYDSTISNELMVLVYSLLARSGYSPWEAQFMAELTSQQGAITPSFMGTTESVSYFRGQVTLMSGLLTTSELGSIISISIVLFCLSEQIPTIVDEWLSGRFIILVQSDDVLFTTDKPLDEEQFKATAFRLGIIAKVKRGSTFLKRFLPVGTVRQLAKPFSRNIQQTIGNEDTYDGKPDAILRLALAARLNGLKGHPLFKRFWPRLFEIYNTHFKYVQGITNPRDWVAGDPSLSHGDIRSIEQYAASAGGNTLLTNLLERAQFDPSAASVVGFLQTKGLTLDFLTADQVKARREYTKALFTPSTPEAVHSMLSFARWNS